MVGSVLDVDKVMFGSDYPHPASTWPNSQHVIQEQWQGVSLDVRQKITPTTPARSSELNKDCNPLRSASPLGY